MTLEEAKSASRVGGIAALVSAGFTILVTVIAMGTSAGGDLALWNDPTIIVDIVIILGCAIGMFRYSRAAAILMTIYWIFAKTMIYLETGAMPGLFLGVVFLVLFVRAIWGTYTYHKLRKEEDENYVAAAKWTFWVGIPLLVIVVILFFFGALSMTDMAPSTEVVRGSDVTQEDRQLLIDNGILYDDESIDYFYSYGLLSVLEGGNILSDRAVITYWVDENDQTQIYELTFPEIDYVELVQEGSLLQDAWYRVHGFGEDNWFIIELSVENDGHLDFLNALRRKASGAQEDREIKMPH